MVNIEQFIKKFDIEAVLDQTGNSIGDSHLPRGKYFCALIYKNSIWFKLTILTSDFWILATLNKIIKKALPPNVRAQKETMDLICFISNAFVDLYSDTANNVCYSQEKKNIIPEHALRALTKLNLDNYMPFMLTDNQN